MNIMPRLWPAALALVAVVAAACGGTLSAPHTPTRTRPPSRAASTAARAGAVTATHHHVTGNGAWPRLLSLGITAAPMTFDGALVAPTVLPRGNSATVSITADTYSVAFYQCPTAEAVNSPAIGVGSCGTLASMAEAFGATRYSSSAALQQATVYQTPPGQPLPAPLLGGIMAQQWVAPGATAPLEVAWQNAGWHVVVAGPSAFATANQLAPVLAHYHWPSPTGLLTVDASGGTRHTSLAWAVGDTVYFTSSSHHPAHALAMAAAMKRYP
ncbi:MAG: hypothetical protein M0Z54_10270 [Thermaerobacter sp.]|nr:hypothetical protein [Thermaerobacter sp.]